MVHAHGRLEDCVRVCACVYVHLVAVRELSPVPVLNVLKVKITFLSDSIGTTFVFIVETELVPWGV